jgi:hypothetical protein
MTCWLYQIKKLANFKAKHQKLLEKHQLSILQTAQQYHDLTEGPGFRNALAKLRLEAEKQRQELDEGAREAWLTMGFNIAKKSIIAASASAITGIAVLRGHSFGELLVALAPAVVSGVGVAASSTLDTVETIHRQRAKSMAYLFEAHRLIHP